MSLQLNNTESLIKDFVSHLQDPEFCDVKIICSDGEIPANKSILGMRSPYFRSMFSSNNNFVESQAGSVKMPHTKAVMEKVVLYICSGKMDCDDLDLGQMLDLLGLLDLMNLSGEFSSLVDFTTRKIVEGKFGFSDCLENLEDSLKFGLVGETLLVYLGENFLAISKLAEVGGLSEAMMRKLLQEKMEDGSQTILRFNILTTWLSVNSMDTEVKEEVLQTLDFDHFTTKQLASEVKKSGLYEADKIIERMDQLFEIMEEELRTENDQLKKDINVLINTMAAIAVSTRGPNMLLKTCS